MQKNAVIKELETSSLKIWIYRPGFIWTDVKHYTTFAFLDEFMLEKNAKCNEIEFKK